MISSNFFEGEAPEGQRMAKTERARVGRVAQTGRGGGKGGSGTGQKRWGGVGQRQNVEETMWMAFRPLLLLQHGPFPGPHLTTFTSYYFPT